VNWEAIGAVGAILSAIAVLITLGYLAVQIRQNTHAMKISAMTSLRDVHELTEKNERYIAVLMKLQRKEDVTPEERILAVERFYTIVRGLEVLWLQQQLGALSEDQFEQHIDLLRWILSLPEPRRMWAQLAPTFTPGFRAVVESEVLAADAPASRMIKALQALDPKGIDRG